MNCVENTQVPHAKRLVERVGAIEHVSCFAYLPHVPRSNTSIELRGAAKHAAHVLDRAHIPAYGRGARVGPGCLVCANELCASRHMHTAGVKNSAGVVLFCFASTGPGVVPGVKYLPSSTYRQVPVLPLPSTLVDDRIIRIIITTESSKAPHLRCPGRRTGRRRTCAACS